MCGTRRTRRCLLRQFLHGIVRGRLPLFAAKFSGVTLTNLKAFGAWFDSIVERTTAPEHKDHGAHETILVWQCVRIAKFGQPPAIYECTKADGGSWIIDSSREEKSEINCMIHLVIQSTQLSRYTPALDERRIKVNADPGYP